MKYVKLTSRELFSCQQLGITPGVLAASIAIDFPARAVDAIPVGARADDFTPIELARPSQSKPKTWSESHREARSDAKFRKEFGMTAEQLKAAKQPATDTHAPSIREQVSTEKLNKAFGKVAP